MGKLTKAQVRVLRFLARRNEHDGPPSGPEISSALGHVNYWAAGKLTSLERRGLIKRLGQTATGGNCFEITPAGRAALKERSNET